MEDEQRSPWLRRVAWIVAIALVAVGAAVGIGAWLYAPAPPGTAPIARELRDRGRIAVVGEDDLLRLQAEGAELVPAARLEGLEDALSGTDEARLEAVMEERAIAGLLVDTRERPGESERLTDRLRSYDRFEVLRGAALTPVAALYLRRRAPSLPPVYGDALARAARQIVSGGSLPRTRAFPEPLRRVRNVEVLVMLREAGRPRLWRSARDNSIARALITASRVARDRWIEREAAMGGPIERRLPSMTIEVYLLEDDGTIGDRSGAFLERVFTPEHGVAYEDGGRWQFLTPEQTAERGEGSPVRAYRALFEDAGLPGTSLETREVRLYRLVASRVGISSAPRSGSSVLGGPLGDPLFEAPGLATP